MEYNVNYGLITYGLYYAGVCSLYTHIAEFLSKWVMHGKGGHEIVSILYISGEDSHKP